MTALKTLAGLSAVAAGAGAGALLTHGSVGGTLVGAAGGALIGNAVSNHHKHYSRRSYRHR